eukprot:TRINITY_DN189075_c0_g1_i1.p1 TRINITY_DN189075_c0_g1~~TRINITY_DN189075_c0_g1_i1.p1  ORF type:complete len:533 (+),score=119.57 TRINITY_DN189075_c0_g1_i1:96-1694(+)
MELTRSFLLLLAEVIFLLVFCAYLVAYYAHKSTSWAVRIAVWLSWFSGFVLVFLLPADMHQSKSGSHLDYNLIWHHLYWFTFVLTWLILALMQDYYSSGHLHFRGRLMDAIKANVRFYVICTSIAVAFIIGILIFGHLKTKDLPGVMIALTNIYGLAVVCIFMGIALVEIPRRLWRHSSTKKDLTHVFLTAGSLDEKIFDAEEKLAMCSIEAEILRERHYKCGGEPAVDVYLDVIEESMPTALPEVRGLRDSDDFKKLKKKKSVSLKEAVSLNARLQQNVLVWHRMDGQLTQLAGRADRLDAQIAGDRSHPSLVASPSDSSFFGQTRSLYLTLAWKIRCLFGSIFLRFVTLISVVLSILVLWDELTIGVHKDLSGFGYFITNTSGLALQFVTIVPLAYMSFCTFSAMFRLRIFDSFVLAGPKLSPPVALIFNAVYLCRIQFSIGFNFLNILHLDASKLHHKLAFMTLMEEMNVVNTFNNYAPIMIGFTVLVTFFKLHARLLRWIGVEYHEEAKEGNVDSQRLVLTGKRILSK